MIRCMCGMRECVTWYMLSIRYCLYLRREFLLQKMKWVAESLSMETPRAGIQAAVDAFASHIGYIYFPSKLCSLTVAICKGKIAHHLIDWLGRITSLVCNFRRRIRAFLPFRSQISCWERNTCKCTFRSWNSLSFSLSISQ